METNEKLKGIALYTARGRSLGGDFTSTAIVLLYYRKTIKKEEIIFILKINNFNVLKIIFHFEIFIINFLYEKRMI